MMNNDERLTFALPRFQTSKKVSVWVKPLKKVQKCDEKMLSILITIILLFLPQQEEKEKIIRKFKKKELRITL
jgi:hypothetical protein